MVGLTEDECEAVVELIELSLIGLVKDDCADSLQWLRTVLNVWHKCGGVSDRKGIHEPDETD